MKYYLEYVHPYMTIKELDDTKFTIKKGCGHWFKVFSGESYFVVDDLYDTIDECVEWLGTYSKKVLFPDGTLIFLEDFTRARKEESPDDELGRKNLRR